MDKESMLQAVASHDSLQRFMFDDLAVRGSVAALSESWRQSQGEHNYPTVVQSLLGELLAAACLLSASLKFDGSIILQIHGDGPVKLLVAECESGQQVRATATLAPDAGALAADASFQSLVNREGRGRFMLTLAGKNQQQPYKGIVPLDGDNIAQALQHYMLRSEQVDTELMLAANGEYARGLLLQKMPSHGGVMSPEQAAEVAERQSQGWLQLQALCNTVKSAEMLAVDVGVLLHRLFWEQDMRLFDAQELRFFCPCSREKVGNMLKMMGRDEIESALADVGKLEVACQFCGRNYLFDAVDCAQLFIGDGGSGEAQGTRH
ncbi:Hsp33 family molecular chaperone HslO [Massilia sp. W12]|uniref:Hsp33 family molecular chaperone HslO n=1 Tax=Massilia sp. W12 TaxID=3126507 RepID=UPI0030CA9224